MHVLATAAQVDDEAARLHAEIRRQRHVGQSRIVAAIVDRHALAPGMTAARACDIVYALMSPDMHRILTVERGWTPEQYEAWLADALARSLLA
jgi:hypothetical protein